MQINFNSNLSTNYNRIDQTRVWLCHMHDCHNALLTILKINRNELWDCLLICLTNLLKTFIGRIRAQFVVLELFPVLKQPVLHCLDNYYKCLNWNFGKINYSTCRFVDCSAKYEIVCVRIKNPFYYQRHSSWFWRCHQVYMLWFRIPFLSTTSIYCSSLCIHTVTNRNKMYTYLWAYIKRLKLFQILK